MFLIQIWVAETLWVRASLNALVIIHTALFFAAFFFNSLSEGVLSTDLFERLHSRWLTSTEALTQWERLLNWEKLVCCLIQWAKEVEQQPWWRLWCHRSEASQDKRMWQLLSLPTVLLLLSRFHCSLSVSSDMVEAHISPPLLSNTDLRDICISIFTEQMVWWIICFSNTEFEQDSTCFF